MQQLYAQLQGRFRASKPSIIWVVLRANAPTRDVLLIQGAPLAGRHVVVRLRARRR